MFNKQYYVSRINDLQYKCQLPDTPEHRCTCWFFRPWLEHLVGLGSFLRKQPVGEQLRSAGNSSSFKTSMSNSDCCEGRKISFIRKNLVSVPQIKESLRFFSILSMFFFHWLSVSIEFSIYFWINLPKNADLVEKWYLTLNF